MLRILDHKITEFVSNRIVLIQSEQRKDQVNNSETATLVRETNFRNHEECHIHNPLCRKKGTKHDETSPLSKDTGGSQEYATCPRF